MYFLAPLLCLFALSQAASRSGHAHGQDTHGHHHGHGHGHDHEEDPTKHVTLKVKYHKPCKLPKNKADAEKAKKRRFIEFAKIKPGKNPLRSHGKGCYSLFGTADLDDTIDTSRIQAKVRISLDSPKNPPQKCEGYDEDGCGGTGSCLYCNLCDLEEVAAENLNKERLYIDGKMAKCDQTVKKGHRRFRLKFCLPSREKMIELAGWTAEKWNEVWEGLSKDGDGKKVAVYLDLLLYEQSMESYALKLYELQDDPRCEKSRKTNQYKACQSERGDIEDQFTLKAIGCHSIWASMTVPPVDLDSDEKSKSD